MGTTTIYRVSAIGELLKSARESCENEVLKTKKGLSRELGITLQRLRNIEDGFSFPDIMLIKKWCELTEGHTEYQAILHAFGIALPPTDPRLLEDLDKQLVNFIKQAEKAIVAAKEMLVQQTKLRPDVPVGIKQLDTFAKLGEIFFDIRQATEAVIHSLELNYKLSEQIQRNWLQKMLLNDVILKSVDKILEIGKEKRIQRKMIGSTPEALGRKQWSQTIPKMKESLETANR